MRPPAYSAPAGWRAPLAGRGLDARVVLPGSKSLTNRELVLAALAEGPSVLHRPLRARDTDLMIAALTVLGARFEEQGNALTVTPGRISGGGSIDCGLAGTVMRFLPPVAALAESSVHFDGDTRARERPMATTIASLRTLGATVADDGSGRLPFTVGGGGAIRGGEVRIDASGSSQFVSGLLLAGARFPEGIEVVHAGGRLPSLPHIDMTIAALQARGVTVAADTTGPEPRWRVEAGPILGRTVEIEPDLSNAAPFLAAALVAGGRVSVPGWPERTTQVGDRLREYLRDFGAAVHWEGDVLTVDGGAGVLGGHLPRGVDLDLAEGGELAPTLVGLAALADSPSRFTGIGHLRGHETDRLAALATELTAVGAQVEELADGLVVHPGRLEASGRPWHVSGDHRMATTGALLGLAVPGLEIDDLGATTKTLPGFEALWRAMLQ